MALYARRRMRIAFAVAFCLLFQQLAAAAYACTMTRMPPAQEEMAEHCAKAAGEHAAERRLHTDTPPALCAKHCTPDLATPADQVVLSVPAALVPACVPQLEPAATPEAIPAAPAIARSDPPPRLRYCSLLI